MKVRALHAWPTGGWRNTRGRRENWRGPRRALTVDEQLEIQRLMRVAKAERHGGRVARELAGRYGVSNRTIWRYLHTEPVPEGLEFLRMRLAEWVRERDLSLSHDDMATLLNVIARHRDYRP